MNHFEDDLQKACVSWFRYQYRRRLIFAVPNGGKRNAREAARMKDQGVTAGVPDLCIPEPVNGYHGLWVELKVGKNKLTENQSDMIRDLQQRGYATVVCYSLEDFQANVRFYFAGGEHGRSEAEEDNTGRVRGAGERAKSKAGEVANVGE